MSTLGLSCPSGGKFYICDKAVTRFIGCCTIDPCGNGMGDCPTEHLKPSSFSSDSYANIPAQNCAAPSGNKTWYTCSGAQPPFMGCCASTNPCEAGKCPQQNLLPARLSDVDADAQIFLDIAHGTQGQASSGPPLGAIIGAAVGGAVLIALIVGFVAYRCGWFARRRREEKSTKNSSDEATKLYDATGDGGLGGLAALHSGTHPSRDWPEHEHIRSDAGSPAPQYSSHSPGFAPYSPGELYNKRYSDGPVEPGTTRENKNHMSPASTASPFPVSPGFPPTQPTSRAYLSHRVSSQSYAPLRESSQTYGNVSELSGSYDPSAYQTSPPHSRRTSELNSYLPNSSPQPSPRTHHDHEYTAMELDASQHSRAAPISELPSHHY